MTGTQFEAGLITEDNSTLISEIRSRKCPITLQKGLSVWKPIVVGARIAIEPTIIGHCGY